MGNKRVLLGVAAVVVSLAAGLARAGDDAPAARAGNGMRVYLDEHGRPTAPPPDTAAEEAPPPVPRRAVRPVPEPAPGGGEMIHNDHFPYSVGRVGKDGRLTVECVHGGPERTAPIEK